MTALRWRVGEHCQTRRLAWAGPWQAQRAASSSKVPPSGIAIAMQRSGTLCRELPCKGIDVVPINMLGHLAQDVLPILDFFEGVEYAVS